MAEEDHLVERDEVADQEASRHGAARCFLVDVGEVSAGNDGLDTRQCQCLRDIDALDVGVRVRAGLHPRVQHAREVDVGAVCRATGDLLDTVGAYRARTYNRVAFNRGHEPLPCVAREGESVGTAHLAWHQAQQG